MEPLPETTEAIAELGAFDPDLHLLDELVQMGQRVQDIVPDCVGLSLSMIEHGMTFTLVASDEEIAVLDAVQYLSGGPCVEAVNQDEVIETDRAMMTEEGWQLFADATAAHGVRSTLSLPVLDHGVVVGGVNLYGGSRQAFSGLHDEVAEVLGAWAPGAVTNADLTFSTRAAAQEAPGQLRAAARVDMALGALAAALGVTIDEARERLHHAAARAHVHPARMAEVITSLLQKRS